MSENEEKKLLEIKDLKIYYPIKGKRDAEGKPAYVKAVDGVTFDVYENETFGLVGESGCGKSTTGRTVVRLNKPTAGSVTFEGHDLFAKMNRQQNMDLTQKIQIIYQDPYSSLDPRFTVGRCIEEPLIVHHMGNKEERRARVLQLMHDVGLREEGRRGSYAGSAASGSREDWRDAGNHRDRPHDHDLHAQRRDALRCVLHHLLFCRGAVPAQFLVCGLCRLV